MYLSLMEVQKQFYGNQVFLILGGVSLVYCVLFYFTVWDKPNENTRISSSELEFLESELVDKGIAEEVRTKHFYKLRSCTFWQHSLLVAIIRKGISGIRK